MGANAYILVLSKFKKEMIPFVSYASENYEDVPDGTLVLFECCHCPTSEISRQLAAACSTELGDFKSHRISKEKVDLNFIREEMSEIFNSDDIRCLEYFLSLQPSDAAIMFVPNM